MIESATEGYEMAERRVDNIVLFAVAIIILNTALFFLVPDSDAFMFNLDSALKEPWRFFTFQFFHVNTLHLVENIIGLLFVAFLSPRAEHKFQDVPPGLLRVDIHSADPADGPIPHKHSHW